jgi:hypothetical protein
LAHSTMAEPTPPWAMKRKASFTPDGGAPLMKRQAKATAPSTLQKPQVSGAPLSKAPITKMPPPGKAPIAKVPSKAPIVKRPPPNQADAQAPAPSPSFAKRPPPAIPSKAPSAGGFTKAVSPASPGSESPPPSGSPPSRGASWAEFQEVDPLYALLGELGDNKIVDSENKIMEDKLDAYFERLIVPGVAKPKDWIEVWAAMNIPVEIAVHSRVVQKIIEIGVQSEVGDTMGEVLAELVKGHRAKVKAVEDAITTVFECGCDEKDCIARFLLLIFPKSPTSDWGWSRVGWSWKEWWGIADKIFACLEKSGAFESLRTLLSLIETDSGTYLPHQQIWDEKRLSLVRDALCRYGNLREDELAAAVDISLS